MTMGNAVAAFIRHFVEAWLLPTWRKIKKLYQEATAAGIVRRCRTPRIGDHELVEYELIRPAAALAMLTEEQADKVLGLIGASHVSGGKRNVAWVSDDCCLGIPGLLGNVPARMISCYNRYCRSNGEEKKEWIALWGGDPVSGGDALLRILGKARNIRQYDLQLPVGSASFPISIDGLQAFLDDIRNGQRSKNPTVSRTVAWDAGCVRAKVAFTPFGGLSDDQQHVVALGCRPEIHLEVQRERRATNRSIKVLLEAMKRNECPEHITFRGFYSPHQIKDIVKALDGNTCVESLSLVFAHCKALQQLSNNQGLRRLHFLHIGPELEDDAGCWTAFWTTIAAHPTLQVLDLGQYSLAERSHAQLEEMAHILRSSTSLQYLYASGPYHNLRRPVLRNQTGFHSNGSFYIDPAEHVPILHDRLLPVLQLNRFRPKVAAIVRDSDPETRALLFRLLLLGDDANRYNPTLMRHLLLAATDLFTECLLPHPRRTVKGSRRSLDRL
jgi:hypothetical protein